MKIALVPSGDELAMKWSSQTLLGYGPARTISFVSFESAATISQHGSASEVQIWPVKRIRPFPAGHDGAG